MNRSIVAKLIVKDLYLYRWLIVGTLVVGLPSIFLAGADGTAGYVGGILLVTSIVVLGVILAIHGLITERHSGSLLFVLSLPISPLQYTAAKVAASMIALLIPLIVMTGTIVGFTLALNPAGVGGLPATIAMMAFFLANFCILITVALISGSEIWAIAGIIGTNTLVPVFLGAVLPAVAGETSGTTAVWRPEILTMLGIEAAVIVLSLGLAFYVQSRRKEFV